MPFRYRFQMVGLDLSKKNGLQFGRLLDFEVF